MTNEKKNELGTKAVNVLLLAIAFFTGFFIHSINPEKNASTHAATNNAAISSKPSNAELGPGDFIEVKKKLIVVERKDNESIICRLKFSIPIVLTSDDLKDPEIKIITSDNATAYGRKAKRFFCQQTD